MLITIQNSHLCLTVDTFGAQMMRIRSADGTEYLWQGDSTYWEDRAPTLFPFIGRLTNNSYQYSGTVYPMGIHGFAAQSMFSVIHQTRDMLALELSGDEDTKKRYPFDFRLQITYVLQENTISISYGVSNRSSQVMPFGIGGHPGFRVPLEAGEAFDDYFLEFSQTCYPARIGFTPALYLSGQDEAYPLEEGRYLPLHHGLFDQDAIILKDMARSVTLRSRRSSRAVTVCYPAFSYLGIWHWPQTDAPYVCLEPWTSLPSRQDIVEEISCKSDMIQLAPGKTFDTTWTISIF